MEDKQEYGMVWQARLVLAGPGAAWHCMAGKAGQGRARRGAAVHGRLGVAGLARLGIVLDILHSRGQFFCLPFSTTSTLFFFTHDLLPISERYSRQRVHS